jgi:hypothetical protein
MQLHIKLVVTADTGFNIIQRLLYERDSNANEHSQKKPFALFSTDHNYIFVPVI